jgi:hypothetical protein
MNFLDMQRAYRYGVDAEARAVRQYLLAAASRFDKDNSFLTAALCGSLIQNGQNDVK